MKATELRKGTVIEQDGDLWLITEYMHHTPGNLRAIIHTKMKSLRTGSTRDMRLGSGDVLEVAFLDKKSCEYLYKESSGGYVFMDSETYEQFTLADDLVGDKMPYVKENTSCVVTFHGTSAIGVELPAAVVLEVIEADPAVRGNTATNVKKDAVVETGLKIRVPIFISKGEKVKIRTEDGEFLGRVND
ncbi:MAG: elongation factor P [Planctomycetaceae bacterium]|nr:elongation factor P [Planctomycetaceae bacterium]